MTISEHTDIDTPSNSETENATESKSSLSMNGDGEHLVSAEAVTVTSQSRYQEHYADWWSFDRVDPDPQAIIRPLSPVACQQSIRRTKRLVRYRLFTPQRHLQRPH